jgi:hypothetical protein
LEEKKKIPPQHRRYFFRFKATFIIKMIDKQQNKKLLQTSFVFFRDCARKPRLIPATSKLCRVGTSRRGESVFRKKEKKLKSQDLKNKFWKDSEWIMGARIIKKELFSSQKQIRMEKRRNTIFNLKKLKPTPIKSLDSHNILIPLSFFFFFFFCLIK